MKRKGKKKQSISSSPKMSLTQDKWIYLSGCPVCVSVGVGVSVGAFLSLFLQRRYDGHKLNKLRPEGAVIKYD